jgi:hypothetical protein
MAKYSNKMMGKEVGQASEYAEPHTMTGKKIDAKSAMDAVYGGVDPNTRSAKDINPSTEAMRVSIGSKSTETKTSGIKTRGNGAAQRGTTARGPMA